MVIIFLCIIIIITSFYPPLSLLSARVYPRFNAVAVVSLIASSFIMATTIILNLIFMSRNPEVPQRLEIEEVCVTRVTGLPY